MEVLFEEEGQGPKRRVEAQQVPHEGLTPST